MAAGDTNVGFTPIMDDDEKRVRVWHRSPRGGTVHVALPTLAGALKHFKFVERGKRRIHGSKQSSPTSGPASSSHLGQRPRRHSSAAPSRLTEHRGAVFASALAPRVFATVHPSAILPIADDEARRLERAHFVAGLRLVAHEAGRPPTGQRAVEASAMCCSSNAAPRRASVRPPQRNVEAGPSQSIREANPLSEAPKA